MRSTLKAMIIGSSADESLRLRSRLEQLGVNSAEIPSMTIDASLETLCHTPTPPDIVFVECEAGQEIDPVLVSRIRGMTSTEIVAVGSDTNSRQVLNLIRAGATDYLHYSHEFEDELASIVSRTRAKVLNEGESGTLISVLSASGGCGASTISVNLAAALANHKLAPCLLDLSPEGGDLAYMLAMNPEHSIYDLCQLTHHIDTEVLRASLVSHECGIQLLAAPPLLHNLGSLRHEIVQDIIKVTAAMFSHVVIDLENAFEPEQMYAIQQSHVVLITLRVELPCLIRCRRILEYLDEQGVSRDRIQLVANRHQQKKALPRRHVVEALGQPITHYLPEQYGLAALSANLGNPVVKESPSSSLAKSYMKMAKSILIS